MFNPIQVYMQDLGGNIGKNPFGENIPAKYKLIKEKQRTFNMDNGLRFGFLYWSPKSSFIFL